RLSARVRMGGDVPRFAVRLLHQRDDPLRRRRELATPDVDATGVHADPRPDGPGAFRAVSVVGGVRYGSTRSSPPHLRALASLRKTNYLPVILNALVAAVALGFVQYTTRQQYRDLREGQQELKQDVRDLRTEMATMRSDLTQVALAVGAQPRRQTR